MTAETFTSIAAAVSALAAVGALIFAWLTVREARKGYNEQVLDRQRERLEEIASLVKHMGEISFMGGNYTLARLRLGVALNASQIRLPKCHALVQERDPKAAEGAYGPAVGEVGNALRDLDPQPHSIIFTAADLD